MKICLFVSWLLCVYKKKCTILQFNIRKRNKTKNTSFQPRFLVSSTAKKPPFVIIVWCVDIKKKQSQEKVLFFVSYSLNVLQCTLWIIVMTIIFSHINQLNCKYMYIIVSICT